MQELFIEDSNKLNIQVKRCGGLKNYLHKEGEKYDKALRKWEKTVTVRMCGCGSPYSFPKEMKDPGICLRCHEPESIDYTEGQLLEMEV